VLRNTLTRLGVLAAVAGLLTGCADQSSTPLGPTAAPTGALSLATTLGRTAPLSKSVTTSVLIDSTGGTIRIAETGLMVEIPAGAVAQPTLITATAIPGSSFAYDFGPHGTKFARPLVMRQAIESGRLGLLSRSTKLEIAYFASREQLNADGSEVLVNEFLPIQADVRGNRVRWEVSHFSGYVVSTGRSSRSSWSISNDDN
jgi:hypothetical protein